MRNIWALVVVWLLLGSWSTGGLASEKGITTKLITNPAGDTLIHYGGSYALLIGVSDYTDGWPDLESIPSELDLLEKALEAKQFKVKRLINPTGSELNRQIKQFIDDYGYDPDNRLLFFYSGHGHSMDSGHKRLDPMLYYLVRIVLSPVFRHQALAPAQKY